VSVSHPTTTASGGSRSQSPTSMRVKPTSAPAGRPPARVTVFGKP